jgi:hypothetical protein
MPKSDLHDLARQRQRCTGEKLHRAVAQLRGQSWQEPLPTASPAQAQLELEVLTRIGRGGVTEGHGWRPGGDPLGIAWVTPLTDALELGAKPEALPDIVGALMPTAVPDDEPRGVLGLRVRHCPAGVELYRLGLPGRLRLPRVTERRWRHAVAVAYYDVLDVAPAARVWQEYPRELQPDEESLARRHTPGYADPSVDRPETAAAASALLRRHLIFRTANPITSIGIWRNGDRIELEWYDGPNHAEIAEVLLDPVVGLPGTIDRPCRCTVDDDCWSVRLRWAHATGSRLNLRRGTWGWTPDREKASATDRLRRDQAMRRCREPVPTASAP